MEIPGYEVLDELGRGGMGVVYRARQTSLKRTVALKIVLAGVGATATDRARFRREAESAARLSHENIVHVYDFSEESSPPFIVMEFVPGGSLQGRIAEYQADLSKAARLMAAVAKAVHHAHSEQVVHRDVKPGNILLTADGRPKLSDFSLAKQLDESLHLTTPGAVMGSALYMAPEQIEARHDDIGPATDVYALGAILYELLAGRPPFLGRSQFEVFQQTCRDAPVPLRRRNPSVPRELDELCLHCLSKKPWERPSSADLSTFDFAAHVERRPMSDLPRTEPKQPEPPKREPPARRDEWWKE